MSAVSCVRWIASEKRRCGAAETRMFIQGPLCPEHAPAAPSGAYCAPERCYCGDPACPAYATYGQDRYTAHADYGAVVDARAIASGKRRSSPERYAEARATLEQRKQRHTAGDTPTPSVLDYALSYATRGWPVFVLSATKKPVRNCERCHVGHKLPEQMERCECLTCHGFYAATTDPDRIRAMLELHPAGLLAMRTGAASGTVVVDVDPPVGLETLPMLDEADVLPGTLMQMTGRDRGFQLFYGHPGVRITSRPGGLGPGVDIKADDAYVVVPPSLHPKTGRAYQWPGDGWWDHPLTPLHPLLVGRLQARPEQTRPMQVRNTSSVPRGRLHGLVEFVLTAPNGERNSRLHWSACRVADMVAAGEVDERPAVEALALAAAEVGLTESEARRTIGSALRKGAA